MTSIFTPSVDLALGTLVALGLFCVAVFVRRLYYRSRVSRKQFRVVELQGGAASLKNILEVLAPPFALEVAVHQLGRDVHTYVAIPANRAGQLMQRAECREVPDYNIYHPGGAHVGGSLAPKGDSSGCIRAFMHLLEDLDFSKVNEVGEGVVFQLVFGRRRRGGAWSGNVRVLVSAPTPYQAHEILSDLEREFSGCRWTEEKDREFFEAVTYRKFDRSRRINWTLS